MGSQAKPTDSQRFGIKCLQFDKEESYKGDISNVMSRRANKKRSDGEPDSGGCDSRSLEPATNYKAGHFSEGGNGGYREGMDVASR